MLASRRSTSSGLPSQLSVYRADSSWWDFLFSVTFTCRTLYQFLTKCAEFDYVCTDFNCKFIFKSNYAKRIHIKFECTLQHLMKTSKQFGNATSTSKDQLLTGLFYAFHTKCRIQWISSIVCPLGKTRRVLWWKKLFNDVDYTTEIVLFS